jgi:hypothetical protein
VRRQAPPVAICGNVRHSAAVNMAVGTVTAPVRWARRRRATAEPVRYRPPMTGRAAATRSLDAIVVGGGPTASPRRSSSPAPGARCACTRPRTPSAAGRGRPSSRCRVRPRRLLGRPSAGDRIAVLPVRGPRAHGVEWVHPRSRGARADDARTVVPSDLSDRGAALDALGRTPPPGHGCSAAGERVERLVPELLRPVVRPPRAPDPDGPLRAAGAAPATALARLAFRGPEARALFAGISAHAMLGSGAPSRRRSGWCSGSSRTPSAGHGPRRSGRIAAALEAEARGWASSSRPAGDRLARRAASGPGGPARPDAAAGARGGGRPPAHRVPSPAGGLPVRPGVHKLDWALDGPIPGATRRPRGPARST